jgi:hypothetical protein
VATTATAGGGTAWSALPWRVRRQVVRDARHGVAPRDPAVARAAAEWAATARWTTLGAVARTVGVGVLVGGVWALLRHQPGALLIWPVFAAGWSTGVAHEHGAALVLLRES